MKKYLIAIFLLFMGAELISSPTFIYVPFKKLLGSGKTVWKNIHNEKDWARLSKLEALYEQNKWLQFTEESEYRIPKVMHLIWLGPTSFPLTSLENVRTWIANHPDWHLKFWTDRPRLLPGIECEVCLVEQFTFNWLEELYEKTTNWAEKSDILRYEILYREGGVYFDHDANSLRSFDGLHRGYDFYACLETPHREIEGYSISVGIGLIGTCPSHPIIRGAINAVLMNWDEVTETFVESEAFPLEKITLYRTYLALTHSIDENLSSGNFQNIVFPSSYFYPTAGLEGIYSYHFYGGSWNDQNRKSDSLESIVLSRIGQLSKELLLLIKVQTCVFAFFFAVVSLLIWRIRTLTKLSMIMMVFSSAALFCGVEKREDFKELMGMHTSSKHFFLLNQDLADYELFAEEWKKSYDSPKNEIPKIIHFIWVGPSVLPEVSINNFSKWACAHPKWKVYLWVDRPRVIDAENVYLRHINELQPSWFDPLINALNHPAEKSHLLRYKILNEEGGVYVDHDVVCIQPIDRLVSGIDWFCGLKPIHTVHYESVFEVSNHLMGSTKGHSIFRLLRSEIPIGWRSAEMYFPGTDTSSKIYRLAYKSQIPLDRVVKSLLKKGEFTGKVYPAGYFYKTGLFEPTFTLNQHVRSWHERNISKHEWSIYKRLEILEKRMHLQIVVSLVVGVFSLCLCIWAITHFFIKKRASVHYGTT